MKKVTILFLTCALLSCSDECDDVMSVNDTNNVAESLLLDSGSSNPNLYVMDIDSNRTRSTVSHEILSADYSSVTMQGTGYTTTKVAAGKMKCAYPGSSPIITSVGLGGGYYFVEVLLVNKTLYSNKPGDMVSPIASNADDKNMGLKTCGYFTTEVGWTPSEIPENGDSVFNGQTYLIHFMYNLKGEKLDKYYPCRPENIVWKYNSVAL